MQNKMMRSRESKKSDRKVPCCVYNKYNYIVIKKQAVSAGGGLYSMPDDYDMYLMKLSDRNRYVCVYICGCVIIFLFRKLKHLRQKNPEQVSLEKREAGFSIYINGEHSSSSQNIKKRDTKTAGKSLPPSSPLIV